MNASAYLSILELAEACNIPSVGRAGPAFVTTVRAGWFRGQSFTDQNHSTTHRRQTYRLLLTTDSRCRHRSLKPDRIRRGYFRGGMTSTASSLVRSHLVLIATEVRTAPSTRAFLARVEEMEHTRLLRMRRSSVSSEDLSGIDNSRAVGRAYAARTPSPESPSRSACEANCDEDIEATANLLRRGNMVGEDPFSIRRTASLIFLGRQSVVRKSSCLGGIPPASDDAPGRRRTHHLRSGSTTFQVREHSGSTPSGRCNRLGIQ